MQKKRKHSIRKRIEIRRKKSANKVDEMRKELT